MKPTLFLAVTAQLVASCAVPAFAQTPLPAGATYSNDPKPLKSYAPVDNPGNTAFDVTDRAAIAKLIYAYSFAYDNFETEAWFSLFTDDVTFVAGTPGQKAVAFQGDGFRKFWRERMDAFRTSGNQRRHLMSNILFLDQTADTAHVSVVGLLTNSADGKVFSAVSSLNYEGWLVKGADGWKIQRWHDFPDSIVPQ